MKQNNIAIDGHSSCGKGTLAKYLASALNFKFIDTGAMYRAITFAILQEQIDLKDEDAIKTLLIADKIHFEYNDEKGTLDITYLNQNIDTLIRMPAVSNYVSQVSEIGIIRSYLVDKQRLLAQNGGMVMDGRDIGSHVLPDALLKIFMTAKPAIRAQRRFAELSKAGIDISYEQILENIKFRDKTDSSRAINPLIVAQDAKILDNSDLTIAEQNALALSWTKVLQLPQ